MSAKAMWPDIKYLMPVIPLPINSAKKKEETICDNSDELLTFGDLAIAAACGKIAASILMKSFRH